MGEEATKGSHLNQRLGICYDGLVHGSRLVHQIELAALQRHVQCLQTAGAQLPAALHRPGAQGQQARLPQGQQAKKAGPPSTRTAGPPAKAFRHVRAGQPSCAPSAPPTQPAPVHAGCSHGSAQGGRPQRAWESKAPRGMPCRPLGKMQLCPGTWRSFSKHSALFSRRRRVNGRLALSRTLHA